MSGDLLAARKPTSGDLLAARRPTSGDLLADPGARRRIALSGLLVLALHALPAGASLAVFAAREQVYEDPGMQMIAEFADMAESAEQSDAEAESVDAAASQSTPEIKKSLSAKTETDLPEADASVEKPVDPELLLAEKRTQERTETPTEQQSTEEMKPTESTSDSAASQAANAPSPMEQTATITSAPAEGSVREAPPTPASWAKSVMAHLGRHKQYPREARATGDEGDVLVAISIGRDGRVLERHIHRSGGTASLDRAALGLVDRAAPLPALPANFLTDRIEVIIPIRYRLKS